MPSELDLVPQLGIINLPESGLNAPPAKALVGEILAPIRLRERFAHQKIVIEQRIRKDAPKAKASLARLWRRDAAKIRKAAIRAEQRAAKAVSHGWELAKPRIRDAKVSFMQAEHKVAHGVWARVQARAAIGMKQ